jgi:hypothetical protein
MLADYVSLPSSSGCIARIARNFILCQVKIAFISITFDMENIKNSLQHQYNGSMATTSIVAMAAQYTFAKSLWKTGFPYSIPLLP